MALALTGCTTVHVMVGEAKLMICNNELLMGVKE